MACERSDRVVGQNPVLDDESGDRGFRVFRELNVVADAESTDEIQVGLCLVEQNGLADGVAHDLFFIGMDFLQAELVFLDAAHFTADGDHVKLLFENICENLCLFGKTDAEGDSEFFKPHFPGEEDGLLQACFFHVVPPFNLGSRTGQDQVALSVLLEDLIAHSEAVFSVGAAFSLAQIACGWTFLFLSG